MENISNQIPQNLQNVQLYLVFECVWLEDGIVPEYKFSSAFTNESDAKTHVELIKSLSKHFVNLHKIIPHIMCKNSFEITPGGLFWNNQYNCWTDQGAFKSVKISEIIHSLNVK